MTTLKVTSLGYVAIWNERTQAWDSMLSPYQAQIARRWVLDSDIGECAEETLSDGSVLIEVL